MSDELNEVWGLFAEEGGLALDAVEEALLTLSDQTNSDESSTLASLFRSMHTFKGNARVLGMSVVESRAHIAEDLIGLVRDEGVPLDGELMGLLLECADCLRGMLEECVESRHDCAPESTDDLVVRMKQKFDVCRQGIPNHLPTDATVAVEDPAVADDAPAIEGLVFERNDESLLADPMYQQLFSELVQDVLKQMQAAFETFSSAPDTAWANLREEADRLHFSASQLRAPNWVAVLDRFLSLDSAQLDQAKDLVKQLQALHDRDLLGNVAITVEPTAQNLPTEVVSEEGELTALLFDGEREHSLLDDPMYREIFTGMVNDVLREMSVALDDFSGEPTTAWARLRSEAERLHFAANQMEANQWMGVLAHFLGLDEIALSEAQLLVDTLKDLLARLLAGDQQMAVAQSDALEVSGVHGFLGVLLVPLERLAALGARVGAGVDTPTAEITQVLSEISTLSAEHGFLRLQDAADAAAKTDWLAPNAALRFRNLEFRLYEELAAIQDVLPPGELGDVELYAAKVLPNWCAEHVFESLLDIVALLDKIKAQEDVQANCEQLNVLMRHVYYACQHYQLGTAAHLCMSLVDLFARVVAGEMVIDALLQHIARSFVTTMELVLDAVDSGDTPDMAVVEKLLQEASGAAFVASGTASSSQIEARLGLPKSFHKVLTPDNVKDAVQALEAGEHFYIVRADLNKDEDMAARFLEWISSGVAKVISNVTVFQGSHTLYDFLMATSLSETGINEALLVLDPHGAALHVEMSLFDRKGITGGHQGVGEPVSGATEAVAAPAQEMMSGEMLESIGELVTEQAMVHHLVQGLLENDIVRRVEATMNAVGGDWAQGRGQVRHDLESWQERVEKLSQLETQINALLDRLQEQAIAVRVRPSGILLRPLQPFIETLCRQHSRQVSLVTEGEDVALDFSMLENLKAPLRAIVAFCALQSIEPPERRAVIGKHGRGQIRIVLTRYEDHVRITVVDDGKGFDLDRIQGRAKQIGLMDQKVSPDWLLTERFGAFANSEHQEGELDFAELRAKLRIHGGDVQLANRPTGGAVFNLTVPLAMVVLEGMVVRVGEVQYIVPIESIQRIVRMGNDALLRLSADQGRLMLKLGQDAVLPVQFLMKSGAGAEQFLPETLEVLQSKGDLQGDDEDVQKHLFVIVGKQATRVAIQVDELVGQQQVLIRPLQGYLSGIRGATGCALLGSGDVGLVLDVGRVITQEMGIKI